MLKQEAISVLAAHRGDAVSVATMQAVAPWHDAGQASRLHIDASACMGSASSLGLGLALGRPDRRVIVLDGDGSLLMQLGSLVTIASRKPRNFFHFVFANGFYESSGNQPVPGQGLSRLPEMALAAGYRSACRISDAAELDRRLPVLLASEGPALVELQIERDDATPRWGGVKMAAQVQALKTLLAANG